MKITKSQLKKVIAEAVRSALTKKSTSLKESTDNWLAVRGKKVKKEIESLLASGEKDIMIMDANGNHFAVSPEGLDPDDEEYLFVADKDGADHEIRYDSGIEVV